MTDDDDTPRRPVRRIQTQTERDIAAERKLREDLKRNRDKHEAVPRNEFERGVDTGVTARIKDDPDLYRLYHKIEKREEDVVRRFAEVADWISQVAGERPPADRISDMELDTERLRGRVKVMWVVMSIVGTLALGSVGAALKLLYDAGVEKGTSAQRIDDLEREVRTLQSDVRDLTRRTAKGGTP